MGDDQDAAFQGWLRDRHQAMATPAAVVDAAVRRATGARAARSTRLIIGQDNEVYDVTAGDGRQVVVRVSHREDPRFEAERWALDAARREGVPTPVVLLIERAEVERAGDGGTGTVTVCVEEKLPGVPLDAAMRHGATPALVQRIVARLGDLLGRLHRVEVDGFGYLRPDGRGWDVPLRHLMLDLLDQRAELALAAERWGVARRTADRGLDLLARHESLYRWDRPRLVHGDLGPPHVLVDGDRVTGLIDLQECAGAHPVFDFAHWEGWWSGTIPTADLMATYPDQRLFDGDYPALFQLTLLRQSLWILLTRARDGNPHGVDRIRASLDQALRWFGEQVEPPA